MSERYRAIKALRRGQVVEVQGVPVKMDGDGKVSVGDSYVAERNTGPKLLVVEKVDVENGWVVPTSDEYWFDIFECVKVCEA